MEVVSTLFLSGVALAAPLDDWTPRESGETNYNLNAIAYGDGQFVAVGDYRTIVSSMDGMTWTPRDSGTPPYDLTAIAYGNGQFVAMGNGLVITSSDGISWTRQGSAIPLNYGITFGNGQFVAVGGFTSPSLGLIMTSPDGSAWTLRTTNILTTNILTTNILTGITYGDGQFVAVGRSGTVLNSRDGINWTRNNSGTKNYHNGVVYGNGRFVLVGWGGGDSGPIRTSPDGITWTAQNAGMSYPLHSIAFDGSQFVAVGGLQSPFTTIISSPDGVIWTQHSCPTSHVWLGVAYGNGQFVAVGQHGAIVQSGVNAPPAQPRLSPILSLPDGTVQVRVAGASGQECQIWTSTDLSNWAVLTNLTIINSTAQFSEPSAASFSQRFYRALVQ